MRNCANKRKWYQPNNFEHWVLKIVFFYNKKRSLLVSPLLPEGDGGGFLVLPSPLGRAGERLLEQVLNKNSYSDEYQDATTK